jgi:hypothetical protein
MRRAIILPSALLPLALGPASPATLTFAIRGHGPEQRR